MVANTELTSLQTPPVSTFVARGLADSPGSAVVRHVPGSSGRGRRRRHGGAAAVRRLCRCLLRLPTVSHARRRAAVTPPGWRGPSGRLSPSSPSVRPPPPPPARTPPSGHRHVVPPAAEDAADTEKTDRRADQGPSDVYASEPYRPIVAIRLSVSVHTLQRCLLVILLDSCTDIVLDEAYLSGGYTYDSTLIRRPFDDHSTAYQSFF